MDVVRGAVRRDRHRQGRREGVCAGPGQRRAGRAREIRTFATTTGALLALRDWLLAEGVTVVGMESTGVYWKPVYYLLEDALECWLLNPGT